MELFFHYDLMRLQAYRRVQANRNQINILEKENYFAFSFPEVGYFNYAITKNNQAFTKEELDGIQDFYAKHKIRKHRIKVISSDDKEKQYLLSQNYTKVGTIVKTILPLKGKYVFNDSSNVNFIKVDQNNIYDFTRTYLDGFEAVGRNYREVAENFGGLLDIPGTELYLVNNGLANVGIIVLYGHQSHYFLAGGAILPKYRNQDYHKVGLSMRLQKCLANPQVKSIISWADKGGISLKNMMTLKMIQEKEFDVYEFAK